MPPKSTPPVGAGQSPSRAVPSLAVPGRRRASSALLASNRRRTETPPDPCVTAAAFGLPAVWDTGAIMAIPSPAPSPSSACRSAPPCPPVTPCHPSSSHPPLPPPFGLASSLDRRSWLAARWLPRPSPVASSAVVPSEVVRRKMAERPSVSMAMICRSPSERIPRGLRLKRRSWSSSPASSFSLVSPTTWAAAAMRRPRRSERA